MESRWDVLAGLQVGQSEAGPGFLEKRAGVIGEGGSPGPFSAQPMDVFEQPSEVLHGGAFAVGGEAVLGPCCFV